MAQTFAVLTGDFVGSSRLDSQGLAAAMMMVRHALDEVAAWDDPRSPYGRRDVKFTRYRGDGWQAILEHPWLAPRAALKVLAHLRAYAPDLTTRISIGLGSADELSGPDLGSATGEAFEHSGRNLDKLVAQQKAGSQKLRRVRVVISGKAITPVNASVITLLDTLCRRWTEAQAQIMSYALHPEGMAIAQIANQHLFISPQAAQARIQSLGYWEIHTTLDAWEEWYASECLLVSQR
jgi:hypothetical protein